MVSQAKRYKPNSSSYTKDRQLSGLFTIVSNNLLLAAELLGTECDIETIRQIGSLSSESRKFATALLNETDPIVRGELTEKAGGLKSRILELLSSLARMLGNLDIKNARKRSMQDLVFVRKLLRESQRGLATVQDVA